MFWSAIKEIYKKDDTDFTTFTVTFGIFITFCIMTNNFIVDFIANSLNFQPPIWIKVLVVMVVFLLEIMIYCLLWEKFKENNKLQEIMFKTS